MPGKMGTPDTFRDCLCQLMEARALSAGQLADLLQYKSKTTLLRILQDKAGVRCIGNVLGDLCRCAPLALTEEEIDRLQVAYDVEMWGLENYRARSEMWRLLHTAENRSYSPLLLWQNDGTMVSLGDFWDRFVPATATPPLAEDAIPVEHLEIYVLSSGYPYVMQTLITLLERLRCRVHVCQILQLTGDTGRTVRLVRNMLPVMPYHNHEVFYMLPEDDISHDPIYAYGIGRALILQAILPGGDVREFQILLRDEHAGGILEAPGIWQYWTQYMNDYIKCGLPMKAAVPDLRDYEQMLEYYCEIERCREILLFKESMCFNFVPVDILVSAVKPHFPSAEAYDQLAEALPRLRVIQEKRFQNITAKREPTYWVTSARMLWETAQTGVMTGHYLGMRPFTVAERIRIYQLVLQLVTENPYFHMYLLLESEEDHYVDMDVAYMVGQGIQIKASQTTYMQETGWTETMLTESSFGDLYREFFMEELIPNHTHPEAHTAVVLRDILRKLEEAKSIGETK